MVSRSKCTLAADVNEGAPAGESCGRFPFLGVASFQSSLESRGCRSLGDPFFARRQRRNKLEYSPQGGAMLPIKIVLHPTDFAEYAEEAHAVACATYR